jgi:conjugal transfer/type IV secretion protein DotA/TraY
MNPNAAPFTPDSGDAAIEMLREIFGTAITHIVGGSTAEAENATANMLGAAFGFFNGGVLFFGSIILAWVTVFGLTNTANDGQVLGKKWSTFYTPLRTFTASAFLIPSTSGYSMIQLAILLIVTWSVGFASNMWGKVVDYVVDTTTIEQVMRSVVDDKQFDRIALNALQMQVCAYGVTRGINETMGQGTVNLQLHARHQRINTGSTTATYKTFLDFRDPNWHGSEEICGTMVLTTTFTKPDTNRASVNQATSTLQDEIANVQGSIGNIRYKAAMDVFAKMAPQVAELVRVADSTGEKFSASRVQAVIDEAREAMLKDVRDEVSKRVGSANSGIKAKLKQGGWVMAGSLHRELLAIKDGIQKAMTTRHQYLPGTYTVDHILGGGGEVSSAVQLVMTRYTSLAGFVLLKLDQGAEVQTRKPTDMPRLRTGLGPEDFADGGTTVKSQVEAWFNGLANWAMSGMVFYLGEDGTDPVMQVKNIGDWMATFGEAVLLTKAALTATVDGLLEGSKAAANQSVLGTNLAGLMSVGPGVLKFILTMIQELWSVVQPGVLAILYGGYFLGMWIPMIPYYVFALGVIGWLVQVVEALAAGSLWMVMHLTPEGDDSFIGSQKQGYLLLVSLFARPPLMVLGLVASMAILIPAVRFVNASFMTAFRIIQADSVTGLLSLGGFMLIYSVIILGVFLLIFSLPQTLPDRILRWIGAGIADLGEQNTMSRIESGASGQAKAAAVAGAAGMARRAQDRAQDRKEKGHEARRTDTGGRDEVDGARPEGHTN